ncbi:MAG: hypothetical protein JST16_04535 [Bdellovibrionales bacterium]|nr:hypothetical protein [Bdellovibrionales bacterium]
MATSKRYLFWMLPVLLVSGAAHAQITGKKKEAVIPLPAKKLSAEDTVDAAEPSPAAKLSPSTAVKVSASKPKAKAAPKAEVTAAAYTPPDLAPVADLSVSTAAFIETSAKPLTETSAKSISVSTAMAPAALLNSSTAIAPAALIVPSPEKPVVAEKDSKVQEAALVVPAAASAEGAEVRKQRWFSLQVGVVASKWASLSPGLANSSLSMGASLSRDANKFFEFGLSARALRGFGSDADDIRESTELGGYGRFRLPSGIISPFVHLGASIGTYRAAKLQMNNASQTVYSNYRKGTLTGVLPAVGARFEVSENMRADAMFGYSYYFDKQARKVGGTDFSVALGFGF